MIRIVSSAVKTSLFAGAVLILAGAATVYSDSCPKAAAKDEGKGAACEAAVEAVKPSAEGAAVKGKACKAACPMAKAACTKVDGEKVKAACPMTKAACTMADGEKVKAACPMAACVKADGEKVKADCPAEKKCCETCKPKAEVKAQATCPVMGGAINKKLYVDHDGKRVYVCCQGCIAPVKKDAEKFIKALEADGVTLERVKMKKS